MSPDPLSYEAFLQRYVTSVIRGRNANSTYGAYRLSEIVEEAHQAWMLIRARLNANTHQPT